MPRVSVIIPTYNRADVIKRAVDSVLTQTYSDYEVIVVDDGSTDQTRQVLAEYGDKIKVIFQENGGASKARNTGLNAAQGEYISLLDSDDWYLPTKLEEQVEYLDRHPEKDVVLCGFHNVSAVDGTVLMVITYIPVGNLLESILWELDGLFPPLVAMFRSRCLEKVDLFDTSLPVREEQDFWMRMALEGFQFGMIENILCMYMNSPVSKGKDNSRAEATVPRILEKILSDEKLPPKLAHRKEEFIARCWLRFGYAYYTNLDTEKDEAVVHKVQGYVNKALQNSTTISSWKDEVVNMLLYIAIDLDPENPEEGLDLIVKDAGLTHKAHSFLVGRLHEILAFRAYESRKRKPVIEHVWKAIFSDIRVVRNAGLLSIMIHSLVNFESLFGTFFLF